MMRMFLGLPQCAVVLFKLVGFGCQKVAFNFGIVKLHKAVSVLFRCTKIRKRFHSDNNQSEISMPDSGWGGVTHASTNQHLPGGL